MPTLHELPSVSINAYAREMNMECVDRHTHAVDFHQVCDFRGDQISLSHDEVITGTSFRYNNGQIFFVEVPYSFFSDLYQQVRRDMTVVSYPDIVNQVNVARQLREKKNGAANSTP